MLRPADRKMKRLCARKKETITKRLEYGSTGVKYLVIRKVMKQPHRKELMETKVLSQA